MRYIVGVDGSAPSDAALRWATARARRDGVPLELLHVIDVDEVGSDPESLERANAQARILLATEADRIRAAHPDVRVGATLLEGSVPWTLTHAAAPDDVLVVGTHKTGYNTGRVLGSRSVQLAAAAPCALAVIPVTDLRFRTDVVAGIDRIETAVQIVDLAAREALARGEGLVLLHAGKPDPAGVLGDAPLRAALDHVRAHYPDLEVHSRRSSRSASAALLDTSRTKAMLVVGPGRTGADRSPIGTVAHEVLLNANSAVLVAPSASHSVPVVARAAELTGARAT
jgi:nucleotide-binding universal stress UspA family protein